ncbi:hypothetical protein [Halorhabdus sp. SVX81]|uniref:hypothetical protein n=1 Tax=Halorhabdus sp. SVX81 TaxID=2978283 RepID=UPI0023DA0FA8|nr:hypothetical protein [Halorhabdus sp. SVX81]
MPGYIHPKIEEFRDSPEPGELQQVVVVYEERVDESQISEIIDAADGDVVKHLPDNSLVATIPETGMGTVCEYSGLVSISPDEGMQVLT